MQPSNLTSENFRRWRLKKGLSHKACARKLGIGISTVFNYEKGERAEGEVYIPLMVALAISAINNELKPYEGDEDDNIQD